MMQRTCLINFATMFLTLNDKAKTDLNANFCLFTIDGDKKIHNGLGHYNYFYCRAGHFEVVSINF